MQYLTESVRYYQKVGSFKNKHYLMWTIYINYGTQSEFDIIASQSFKTKKSASVWAKEHGYPQKCVMRTEEAEARRGKD